MLCKIAQRRARQTKTKRWNDKKIGRPKSLERSFWSADSTWNGFRAIVPNRRIDFIFVRPGTQVHRHRTLDNQTDGRFPSDHLPVVVDLVLGSRS